MIIDADGFAYPCDALKQVKLANQHNNVLRDPLLRVIENAPLFQMVRHSRIPETCIPCPKVKECFGGCLAQRLLTVGDPSLQADPGCLRQRASKSSSHVIENVVSAGNLPQLDEAQWIS
ncbi:MAG: SPASM domain-containing protein [Deltaproteobacteria bacterium]|nr:SPASM domain-containing protein [Deltaproteobacteria bacterium]